LITNSNTTVTVGALNFNAPGYTIESETGEDNVITGSGVSATFGNRPTFTITNESTLQFFNTSTAGTAKITAGVPVDTTGGFEAGFIQFFNNSTAGSATITAQDASNIEFHGASNAGNATLIATPGFSTGGFIFFFDNSNAGHATIINDGAELAFAPNFGGGGTASAGDATITTGPGSLTHFQSDGSGGNAQFITEAGGLVDFSGLSANGTTAGSIAGAGTYDLGSKQLIVGSNNLSTTVSGLIEDGGEGGGVGGSLVKVGTGTLTLSGDNTYTGGTTINGGALQLGDGAAAGSIIGNVVDNGTLAFDRSDAIPFPGVISGTGGIAQIGSGVTTLTASNTYAGPTTVVAGTLAAGLSNTLPGLTAVTVGSAGTLDLAGFDQSIGSLAGAGSVSLGSATLTTGADTASTQFSGVISGNGSLNKVGTGTFVLSGANTYTGVTTVNAGTLLINGNQSAATGAVSVASGATLDGMGTTGGDVSIASGGHLGGTQPETFTMNSLTLVSGSNVDVSLANPSPLGPFNVNGAGGGPNAGNLTLAGNLNIAAIGPFGPGVYRIIDYTGALTDNGMVFGTVPPGFIPNVDLSIQTSVAQQVNLAVLRSPGPLTFWDGGNPALFNNGAVDGGAGTWLAGSASNSWTNTGGSVNGGWQPNSFAIFQVNPGIVTVDNSAGQVTFSGAQFAVDGYVITGAALTTTTADTILRVGDGTDDGASMTATISAAIQGTGGIEKTDLGTLVLTGLNTYTGGTTISEGVLSISNDANLGDPSGGLTFNGGTLLTTAAVTSARGVTLTAAGGTIDNGGQTDLFSGAFTGPGGFISTGAGTLILTGTSTYAGPTTIAAGTLQISADANLGAPTGALIFAGGGLHTTASIDTGRPIDIPGAGFIDTDPSTLLELDGPIAGSGALTKTGAGELLITAGGPFSGSADVGAGVLAVNGNLGAAAVTVENGAALIGHGVVGTTALKSGATIAPGPGIATLTVNGGYAQGAGATYQALVDPTSTRSSLITVNGEATLASGAVLNVTRTLAAPYQLGARYTVLTATGGLTGTFDITGDTSLSAFTGLMGVYDPNDAFLVVEQNRPLTAAARTPNQSSAAAGAQSVPTGAPLLTALVLLPNDAVARVAFDQISGEFHASIATAFLDDSRFLREAVGQRLRGEAGQDQAGPHGDPGGLVSPGVWGHVFGSWGSYDSTLNAAQLDRSIGGFFMGADTLVGSNWRVGAVGGYSHSSFNVGDLDSSGSSDDIHLGAYAGTDWNHLSFQSGFGYTWHEVHATRLVNFPGISNILSSNYNAQTAQVFGEVGYRLEHGVSMLEPILDLAYVHLHTDGFQESGGAAALTSASHGTDTVLSTLGARVSTTIRVNETSHAEIFGMIGWRHAFGDVTPTSTFTFAGGQPFGIEGVPIARDAAAIEAGASRSIGRSVQVGVYYSGLHGSGVQDDGVRAYVGWRF
jgi:outer membrane autotransporter protein